MGSLTSGPKAPAPSPQQVVYVPPASSTTPAAVTSPDAPTAEAAATARTQSLLSRSRGRLGTIATSFRGFLGEQDASAKRKTLLGE